MKALVRRIQWGGVAWLAVVWVVLWGDLSVANVAGGALLGAFIMLVFPLPPLEFHGRVRPWYFFLMVVLFLRDVFMASFQVAFLAMRWWHRPRSAVVRVQLRSRSDLYLSLTAEMSTLVPGSLVIEAHRLTSTLYLHVLDIDHSGGVDKVRETVWELESRVLRALGSDEELADAGVALGRKGPVVAPTAREGRVVTQRGKDDA